MLISCVSCYGGKQQPQEKIFPESKLRSIDGVEFHYRQFSHSNGQKSGNILLIHGFSGSTFSWRKNYSSLVKAGFDVIAVDLPAFGYSSRAKHVNHSTSALATDLWKLVTSIDSGKWTLVGHSMGASLVGAMAAMKPDLTEKLVFVDGAFSGTLKGNNNGLTMRLIATAPIKCIFDMIARKYFFNFSKFKSLLSSAYACEPDSEAVNGYLAPFKIKKTVGAILDIGKSKEIATLYPEDMKCDMLLIWGKKDTWIPIKAANKFVKKFPKARLEVIEGAGHCAMETQSEEFNVKLVGFLKAKLE